MSSILFKIWCILWSEKITQHLILQWVRIKHLWCWLQQLNKPTDCSHAKVQRRVNTVCHWYMLTHLTLFSSASQAHHSTKRYPAWGGFKSYYRSLNCSIKYAPAWARVWFNNDTNRAWEKFSNSSNPAGWHTERDQTESYNVGTTEEDIPLNHWLRIKTCDIKTLRSVAYSVIWSTWRGIFKPQVQ